MIFGFHWALILVGVLSIFFIGDAVVSAIGPKPMRESFVKWGFPGWWHLVNAAVCLAVGLLLLVPTLRPFGLLLGALECLAIFATLIRAREPGHLPPSVFLLGLICVAYWGLYGFALPSVAAI
ncbi:hypothetical protein VW35_01155 [Devosia soli]|uniref:DoxX family protein n=1 Tax=Devosia soli TaxID=361041 RepID=A0A0F5LEW9_9HYPH|nr:DoxX family protein [Devosia soli]KKB80840.1 hypothetical protein VW35_01155 [Devosia soli]